MGLIGAALAVPVQAALMLAAAMLLPDLAGGARPGGRLREWRRLWRKQAVLPANASPVFRLAAAISCACAFLAALLVPSFTRIALAPASDPLLILALLGASSAVRWLAALDAGTSLPGHEAERAMAGIPAILPALLLGVFVLAKPGGGTAPPVSLLLLAASLVLVARRPGAIRLATDYGGRDLALLHLADALGRIAMLGLIADLLLPWQFGWGWLGGAAAWAVKIVALELGLIFAARLLPPAPRAAWLATLLTAAAVLLAQGAA